MKNFNLLRKSERKSVGTTLALTVGSPSFDRRYSRLKHLAFMLLFLLGSLNVWGATDTKEEGFERATTGNAYQGDASVTTSDSDCGISWAIHYGCVSTSSKITGNNSAALRLYKTGDFGYLNTTTAINGLTEVSFNAKAATSNSAKIKIDVNYSTDGTNWSPMKKVSATGADFLSQDLSTQASQYTAYIPSGVSGNLYFQIAINSGSTRPTKSGTQLTIDDVVFTYETGGTPEPCKTPTVEWNTKPANGEVGGSMTASVTTNYSNGLTYSSSNPTVATVTNAGVINYLSAGTTTITATVTGDGTTFCEGPVSVQQEITVTAPAGGGGGGTLSHTWDLTKISYSAASAEQVTWSSDDDDNVENDVVKMIVEKGAAETAPNSYLGDANSHTSSRFYQNSNLKIMHRFDVTITSVVFTAKTEADATALQTSDWSNAADVTASGTTVTVTPNDPIVDISAPIGETCDFTGVTVYYTKGDPEPETPTFSVAAGTYTSVQSVELSCATEGATIYYTTNGDTPNNTSTEYTAAISVGENMTIKAIAIKDAKSSSVAEAAYVINLPEDENVRKTWNLSIDETATASDDELTWTATYVGMSYAKGKASSNANNYYPGTAGQSYTSTRFYKNGVLTITPSGKQITSIVFTATSNSYATALANSAWTNATAAASGTTVTVTATDGESAISATIGATCGFKAVQVNYIDIDMTKPETPVFSVAAGTYTEVQNVTITCATEGATIYYTTDGSTPDNTSTEYTGSAISLSERGTYTIKAIAIKDAKSSAVAEAAYVINLPEDENVRKTWDLSIDETASASTTELTWTATYIGMSYAKGTASSNANNYYPGTAGKSYTSTRFYTNGVLTITPSGKQITSIVFTATTTDYANALQSSTWTNGSAAVSDKVVTVTPTDGESAISATIGATCGFTAVQVNYITDTRVAAGLTWSTDAVEITLGELFSAPTLNNPNSIAAGEITIESNNISLATVAGGVVSLVENATGTATITASFAGNASYKPATVSYNITVNAAPVPAETKNIVVLAEYNSKFYAMTNSLSSSALAAVEVEKDGSNIVVSSAEDKAAIQWTATVEGENTTLMDANNKYIKGSDGASLSLDDAAYIWNWDGEKSCYISSEYTTRGLFFNNSGVFKGYATSNLTNDAYAATEVIEIASENIVITSKVDPALAYSPVSETITAGDAWSAPTLSNIFNVTPITYSSDKESVATVTSEGVITLAGGYGTAVITAHFDESAAYFESEATYTITVNKPAATPTSTVYRKVTKTADITDGEYLIVYEGDATQHEAAVFDGSLDNVDQAKKALPVEIVNNEIAGNTDLDAATFTIDVTTGTLKSASGWYIGKTENSNGLDKSTTEAYANTFAITNGAAVITGVGGCTLRYNYAVDQLRFRYYKSGQQDVQLYKKVVTPPTPDYGSYQRTVTAGNYGTICLPQAGTIEGATLYEIGSFENNIIYVDEVIGGVMEAGKPYIFQATADQLNVTYTSATVEQTAGNANGLHGFYNLEDENATLPLADNASLGNYILYQNAYWLVSGRAAYIANYRAYIKISEIQNTPAPEPTPGQAPRRRVAMSVHGEQVATGFENGELINGENGVQKVLIDGELFILRGEKMYDAKGQLVK